MRNAAFLGAGGMAAQHLVRVSRMSDISIVGVCDVDEARATALAEQYETRAYFNLTEMLDSEEIDAVWVCIPPGAHGGQVKELAGRGLHMFIEKPVGLDLEQCEEALDAVRKAGVITSVGYQKRYSDLTDRARRIIKDHRPVFARGAWIGGMPGPMWWRRRGESGGQIIEQSTHIFDLTRYLFGEAKSVSAVASFEQMEDIEKFDVETASLVNVVFKSAVVANIASSCIVGQGFGENIEVFSRDFHFDLRGESLTLVEPNHREEFRCELDSYTVENEVFVDSIRTGNPSRIRSTYADALRTLKLTLAAVESLEGGGEVEVE